MTTKLPNPDIDTANHAGIRVKAYSEHAVREILAAREKETNEQVESLAIAVKHLMATMSKPNPQCSCKPSDESDSWFIQDTSKREWSLGEWLTVGPTGTTTNVARATVFTLQQALDLIESGRGSYAMWPTRYVHSHSYYTWSKQEYSTPTQVIDIDKLDRIRLSHYEKNKR